MVHWKQQAELATAQLKLSHDTANAKAIAWLSEKEELEAKNKEEKATLKVSIKLWIHLRAHPSLEPQSEVYVKIIQKSYIPEILIKSTFSSPLHTKPKSHVPSGDVYAPSEPHVSVSI
jgi:hypothetical protein